jgi:ribosomal protein S18 acetylase RimI-like enzyme
MTPAIRPALESEADEIGVLTERAYRADGYLDGDVPEDRVVELTDGRSRVRDATVLVAEVDGTVVGTVTLAPFGTAYAETAKDGELEVRMLGVSPEARRQGIAARLMTAALDHARERGMTRIVLCTDSTMPHVGRYYERLGYERQPERDWNPGSVLLLSYGLAVEPV